MTVAAKAKTKTKTKRGDLAREKLKAAAVRVLNQTGFHQMRIKDVTQEAGVATGLFYHYFKNLESLVREVMSEHIERFEATADIERDVSKGAWLERMRSHYRLVVQTYAEEPGVMRCVQQFAADDPAFREHWRSSYNQRMEQLVQAFPRVFPEVEIPADEVRLLVFALGGIGQDFLHEYYVEQNADLRSSEYTQDQIADWLAALFYRGLFASNPARESLSHAQILMDIKRGGL